MLCHLPAPCSQGPDPTKHQLLDGETVETELSFLTPGKLDLGSYRRHHVSNLTAESQPYFDLGLRLMLSYQHEMASRCFLACLQYSPSAALAHGLIARCHAYVIYYIRFD
jgi:hypothetical protein